MPKLTSVLLSHWCYPIGVIEETNTKFLSYSKKRYSFIKISLKHLEFSNLYPYLKQMKEFHDKLLLSLYWRKKILQSVLFLFSPFWISHVLEPISHSSYYFQRGDLSSDWFWMLHWRWWHFEAKSVSKFCQHLLQENART